MKAKVVECFKFNAPNQESMGWCILIKRTKGEKYNILVCNGNKPYFTLHKNEAIEQASKLNCRFQHTDDTLTFSKP